MNSGKTLDEAEEIAKKNIEVEDNRRKKLAERAERQKAASANKK